MADCCWASLGATRDVVAGGEDIFSKGKRLPRPYGATRNGGREPPCYGPCYGDVTPMALFGSYSLVAALCEAREF